jgi:hypothetical protein
VKLSEIAVRLARPLVCGVFGHERWPFDRAQPLQAFRAEPGANTDYSEVELELCRRCGSVYAARWEWRRDFAAEHGIRPAVRVAPSPPPEKPEAA